MCRDFLQFLFHSVPSYSYSAIKSTVVIVGLISIGNCPIYSQSKNPFFDVAEISPGLFIDKTEVSNELYYMFMESVRDSLAHAYLYHYIEDEETGEERIDWEFAIDWNDETLEDLFYQGDDRLPGLKEFDVRKLIYEIQWYDWEAAALDRGKSPRSLFRKRLKVNVFPDLDAWRHLLGDFSVFADHYLHGEFSSYPIVGVSLEQAQAFCDWRTGLTAIKKLELPQTLKEKFKNLNQPIKVVYRVPTVEEWIIAAGVAPLEKEDKYDHKIDERYHFAFESDIKKQKEKHFGELRAGPTPVGSYLPDKNGVYHLWGNVAELTSTPGIAKGGSWLDLLSDINDQTEIFYSRPQAWLGFRCICQIPVWEE